MKKFNGKNISNIFLGVKLTDFSISNYRQVPPTEHKTKITALIRYPYQIINGQSVSMPITLNLVYDLGISPVNTGYGEITIDLFNKESYKVLNVNTDIDFIPPTTEGEFILTTIEVTADKYLVVADLKDDIIDTSPSAYEIKDLKIEEVG